MSHKYYVWNKTKYASKILVFLWCSKNDLCAFALIELNIGLNRKSMELNISIYDKIEFRYLFKELFVIALCDDRFGQLFLQPIVLDRKIPKNRHVSQFGWVLKYDKWYIVKRSDSQRSLEIFVRFGRRKLSSNNLKLRWLSFPELLE